MKRTLIILVVLLAGILAFAQATPQQPAAAPGAAAQQPAKKGPPAAKTQEEFKAYNSAVQLLQGQDLAAAETAADAFATQFPQSDLRSLLYQNLMNRYQSSNNGDKVVEIGRKVVAIDGANPVALVMIATVLSERTRDTDLDKDERLAEAVKDANKALESVDNIAVPPGAAPEQIQAAKSTISSMAYGALGTVATVQQNWTEAETQLRKSVAAPGIEPDPLTLLRLCITLDHEKKYAEALQVANQTVDVASKAGQSAIQQLAQQQRDRLVKLSAAPGSGTPATGATPPKPPSQ